MRLHDAVYIASLEDIHNRDRTPTAPEKPRPRVGALFGKPSAFGYSRERAKELMSERDGEILREGDEGKSWSINLWDENKEPVDVARFVPCNVNIYAEDVRIEDPSNPQRYLKVNRVHQMLFSYVEYPPRRTPVSPLHSIRTNMTLNFDLSPEGETLLGSGENTAGGG